MRLIRELTASLNSSRRRGAVAAFTAVTMVVLVGFAALTIDVGYMYSVRLDLQNAADAAAMTAAGAYGSDTQYLVQAASADSYPTAVKALAYDRASILFKRNASMGRTSTIVDYDDLMLGRVDVYSTAPIQTGVDPEQLNAVYVMTRRDTQSENGPVELFFSRVFGYHSTNITASAVAAFDDRVAAVRAAVLIPFTIHKDIYDKQVQEGNDNYQFDDESETVSSGADAIKEIHLFPYDSTPGNFGLLNIGGSSSSGAEISAQIENGIASDELEASFGTPDLHFTNSEGDIEETAISGNTGLHASFESEIGNRIGEVIGIFLHEDSAGTGATTTYQITGIRFVRIMAVNLSGKPQYFIVQPGIYAGDGVILDADAPSTGGLMGRIVLAR